MEQSVGIMTDDMAYIDMGYVDENYMGTEMLPYDDSMIAKAGTNNVLVLSLVIGVCVILGVVLGIVLGRRAAKK